MVKIEVEATGLSSWLRTWLVCALLAPELFNAKKIWNYDTWLLLTLLTTNIVLLDVNYDDADDYDNDDDVRWRHDDDDKDWYKKRSIEKRAGPGNFYETCVIVWNGRELKRLSHVSVNAVRTKS